MNSAAHSCGSLSRESIARQRADGTSVDEIANQAGVSRRTMYNALSAWGLVGRRGGDHRSRNWQTLFREQLAHAIASAVA